MSVVLGRARGRRVAVITDSTASLPDALVARYGIGVVPLDVIIGGEHHVEGEGVTASELVAALESSKHVTTSQPAPAAFARAYAQAAQRGAREIVSVHLSGELSGTFRAAELAALGSTVPVHLVDSRSTGMGLGFAAVAAAEQVRARPRRGENLGGGAGAAERAREVATSATVVFLVDTLEYLRRGGRLSAAAAALGTVLGLRPLLTLRDGRIEVLEKVRTRRAARERLVQIAAAAAADRDQPRVAVHHLGQPDTAGAIAQQLASRSRIAVEEVVVSQISAVVGAHAGPGLLAVVVADR